MCVLLLRTFIQQTALQLNYASWHHSLTFDDLSVKSQTDFNTRNKHLSSIPPTQPFSSQHQLQFPANSIDFCKRDFTFNLKKQTCIHTLKAAKQFENRKQKKYKLIKFALLLVLVDIDESLAVIEASNESEWERAMKISRNQLETASDRWW